MTYYLQIRWTCFDTRHVEVKRSIRIMSIIIFGCIHLRAEMALRYLFQRLLSLEVFLLLRWWWLFLFILSNIATTQSINEAWIAHLQLIYIVRMLKPLLLLLYLHNGFDHWGRRTSDCHCVRRSYLLRLFNYFVLNLWMIIIPALHSPIRMIFVKHNLLSDWTLILVRVNTAQPLDHGRLLLLKILIR